jgi:hypothetical protein
MAGEGIGITDRVAKVTLAHWAKHISDQAKNRFPLMKILSAKGRIKRGKHGGELRWPVQFKQHALKAHIDAQAQVHERFNELVNANLRWAGLEMTDAITHQEKEENGGEEAVVKIFAQRAKLMQRDALQQFGKKPYLDGAAGPREFHGIESLMSLTGQTATDEFATTLNDTYAGLSTSYTSFKAGASKGVDEEYGAWSPVVVNCNRTVNAATRAWDDFADEYIRAGLLEATYGDSEEDCIDLVLLRKASFKSFMNLLDDKERVNLVKGDSPSGSAYGFNHKRFISFDGCAVGWDFGVPAADLQAGTDVVHGYGFNTDMMELCLLGKSGGKGDTIFSVKTSYDPFRMADLIRLYCLGNFKFESPRHFMALKELS